MFGRRAFLAAIAAVVAAPQAAFAASWVVLGSRRVRRFGDHDVIAVGADRGRFTRLRLQVAENGIMINTMHVTFGDGTAKAFDLRNFIERGGRTRDLILPGGGRTVKEIDFYYARRPGGGLAVVTVLGLRL